MNSRVDLAEKRGELNKLIRTAAIAEFSEHGLRGASTQGIADRAGISKTKLHYYINSKEDLYRQALDHIVEIWAMMFEDIPLDKGPEEFLADYVSRKVHFSLDHPAEVRMFTREIMSGAWVLREQWSDSRDGARRAAQQINKWVEDGLIRPVDPMLLQFHLWALTESYAVMANEARFMMGLEPDAKLDAEKIIEEITALVMGGIRL